MINEQFYRQLKAQLDAKAVTLVAVSKTKPVADIRALYDLGQRDFGENYVQELVDKQAALPEDIRWHFIGHLQTNKVKFIAPFVHLIQSVDSTRVLDEIAKQAEKNRRTIRCLLQVHIAQEETKFGFLPNELPDIKMSANTGVMIDGLMGMASNTNDEALVRQEFQLLCELAEQRGNRVLSFGMSNDYKLAIECGSTMVRIGSLLFGNR